MADQKRTNDAKRAGGYLKEKFTIGIAHVTSDEVMKAIMKTTSHKLKIPNEKHMNRLLSASHGVFNGKHDDVVGLIVHELEKRMHVHNWVVVLKTLLVFHRFFHEGSIEIIKRAQNNHNLFCMRHMKDLADTPDGAFQRRFIQAYTQYLEERSCAQRFMNLSVRVEEEDFLEALRAMDMPTLAPVFNAMLKWTESLTHIEYSERVADNFASVEAYRMIIKDGKRLYYILSNRVMHLLDVFDRLPRAEKLQWFELYKRYDALIGRLNGLFQEMQRGPTVFREEIPELRLLPGSLIGTLERDIAGDSRPGDHETVDIAQLRLNEAPMKAQAPQPSAPMGFGSINDSGHQVVSLREELAPAPQPPQPSPQPQRRELSDIFSDAPSHHTPVPTQSPPPQQQPRAQQPPAQGLFSSPSPASSATSSQKNTMDLFAGMSAFDAPPSSGHTPNFTPNFGGPSPAFHQKTSPPPPPPPQVVQPKPSSAADFDPFADPVPVQKVSPPPHQQQQQQQQGPIDFFAVPGGRAPNRAPAPSGGGQQPNKAW